MKRNSKYVGLDVHQAMTAVTVRGEGGRVIMRNVIETRERSIKEFFSALGGTVRVAFEEGTQAQWLYDLLSPRMGQVIVCDLRGERRSGNKGDRVDADHLSEQLLRGGPRSVHDGSQDRADLKELTRACRHLVEDNTCVMLRLKALFRARSIRTIGGACEPTERAPLSDNPAIPTKRGLSAEPISAPEPARAEPRLDTRFYRTFRASAARPACRNRARVARRGLPASSLATAAK